MGTKSSSRERRERASHQKDVAARSAYLRQQRGDNTGLETPALWKRIFSGTVAAISIVGLFIADLPLVARTLAVLIVGATVAVYFVRGRARLLVLTTTLGLALALALSIYLARPSEAEQVVDEYVDETLKSNIWVAGEPEGYEVSKKFMVDNFEAFDPKRFHSWEELADPIGVSLHSVVTDASLLAGRAVAFAGTVNASQQLGDGEFLVQLIPLWPEDSDMLYDSPVASSMLPELEDSEAFDNGGIRDPHASRLIVYVRITPRNFVLPQAGDVWLVTGTTLAYGRTLRGDGELADVAYVAGSSAEHLDSVHKSSR